jgi:hypothetical protein
MELIRPLDKVTASSKWALQTAAFDLSNEESGSRVLNTNGNTDANTPNGVLGGMCARGSANWEAREGIHTLPVLGLFANNSEGNAFENTPAIASGVVPIYMNGGAFLLYLFETNAHESAFADILSTYDVGDKLYCSAFGLLTTELPSAHATTGVDNLVAICAKTPTASDLELGIKLVV